MAKVVLDYKDSKRQIAPEEDYGLRIVSQKMDRSKKGAAMIVIEIEPFDPPAGVGMDQIDKIKLTDYLSLQPQALFKVKQVYTAIEKDITCNDCSTDYPAILEECPNCQGMVFSFDPEELVGATCRGHMIQEALEDGRIVNKISKYFKPAA